MSARHAMAAWLGGLGVGWLVLWLLGVAVRWPWLVAVALAGLLLRWVWDLLPAGQRVEWPPPTRPGAQRWFGIDPLVRRLSHEVQAAGLESHGSDVLRARLLAETGRRLVEHHGADPATPLARGPELLGDQTWKLLTTRRRLNSDQLSAVTRRIEDL